MSGLEIITKTILDEASAEAQAVLDQARADAVQIVSDAKAITDAACQAIAEDGQQKAAAIRKKAGVEAEMERRRALLHRKQQLLDQAMRAGLETLLKLPEAEYFELLILLASRNAEPGTGIMLLSPKDLGRLPADFHAVLNAALPKGSALEVSAVDWPMDGGFVLQYGDIERNCSFSAIFDEKCEQILDAVREILFA